MRTSISHIKEHMTCPAFAVYRNVNRRDTVTKSIALDVGTLLHEELARKLGGNAPLRERVLDEETVDAWEKLRPAVDAWEVPPEWRIIAVEKELEFPIGRTNHILVGRLDTLVEYNGLYWHVQHKSIDFRVPLNVFIEQQTTDWHEIGYACMARLNLDIAYDNWGGTILNVFRKFTGTAKNLRYSNSIHYLTRTFEIEEKGIRDMARVMTMMEEGERSPIQNRAACAGPFRNRLCQYKPVCDRIITLDDPMYVDIPNRYPEK